MSPTGKRATRRRMGPDLDASRNLVTGQKMGMDLPNRLNPGPLASRITFFAPVSLLFFLTVMVMLGVACGREPPPDELLLPRGRVLRLPPAAGVPGGPHVDPRVVRDRGRDQPRAGGELPARGRPACGARCVHAVAAQFDLPRALQLRILLRRLHGVDGDRGRGRHAVRADADDRARALGRRCSPRPCRARAEAR